MRQYKTNRCVCLISQKRYADANPKRSDSYVRIWIECPCEAVVGQILMTYPMGEEPVDTTKVN